GEPRHAPLFDTERLACDIEGPTAPVYERHVAAWGLRAPASLANEMNLREALICEASNKPRGAGAMTKGGSQGLNSARARAPTPQEIAIMRKLRQAVTTHQEGRLGEAEPLYREVLALAPGQPDAMHFLGVLESQRGNT